MRVGEGTVICPRVDKSGFVHENPGTPTDTIEACLLPSRFFLGSCWPCRTPGAFWPEGESGRGRGMGCRDERRAILRMSVPTMELNTRFPALLQGEPGETGPPGRVSGIAVGCWARFQGHLWVCHCPELLLPGSAWTYWSCGTPWPSWPFRPCGELW